MFSFQNWNPFPQLQNSEWTLGRELDSEPSSTDIPIIRRRRVRKRKRRPQYSLPEFEGDAVYAVPPRRRLRPVRLEENREAWHEIEEESGHRPSSRRRIMPKFSAEDVEQNDDTHVRDAERPVFGQISVNYEKVRDPFTALKEEEEKLKVMKATPEEATTVSSYSETTVLPKLKAVLKQTTGSLSLSELLQQKNLTLAELLNGNPDALSALTEKPDASSESSSEAVVQSTTEPIKQRKTYSAIRKQENRNPETVTVISLMEKDTLDAQKRRLALLQSYKENKTEVIKPEVTTESTTERRMFTIIDPESKTEDYILTTSEAPRTSTNKDYVDDKIETTTKQTNEVVTLGRKEIITNRMSLKPKLKIPLPTTVAKQNEIKLRSHENENSAHPSVVATKSSTNHEIKEEEGPMKITIDIENEIKKSSDADLIDASEINMLDFSARIPSHEKLKSISAKEELMEILKDPISRERLSRILEHRNMTLDELVEQRERGSSQLHLADIFHSQQREPQPKEEPHIGKIHVATQTDEKVHAARVPIEFKTGKSLGKTVEFPKPNVNPPAIRQEQENDEAYMVTSFPAYRIEMEKSDKDPGSAPLFPFWGNIYTPFYTNVHTGGDREQNVESPDNYLDLNNVQRVEEIENKIAESVNEKLNVDFNQNSYSEDDYGQVSSGVKSAIFASAVIVGASIIVFLTIFVVFKWSQKQKRLNYSNSFSGSRIKSPILEVQQKRSLRTIMTETLGRKKPNYQQHLQSMSDISWDSEKKPYQ